MSTLFLKPFRSIARSRLMLVLLAATDLGLAAQSGGLERARSLYSLGQFEEAREAFEEVAATEPTNLAEAHFHLGEIALRAGHTEKAITYLEQAVAAAPGNSRYHHRLGDAYGTAAQKASIFTALGWAKKCLRAFQRAVELDPTNLDARFSLFTFYLGAPGIIGGGEARAAAEAAAINKLDPQRGRIALAALLVSQKKYDAARAAIAEIAPVALASVRDDRVFLSDVEWSSAEVGWGESARNHMWFDEKSDAGVVLIVHGRLYSKGLYAHAPSRYRFRLEKKWQQFTATIGLREGAHQQGSAVFIVRTDGREVFRSTTLRVNASRRVTIDLNGVEEFELVTQPGEDHNHFAWAIWAEPMLRR